MRATGGEGREQHREEQAVAGEEERREEAVSTILELIAMGLLFVVILIWSFR